MEENKKTASESAPGIVEIMELIKANQDKDKELADLNNKILQETERQVKLLEEQVKLLKEQRDAADEECEMFYTIMKNGLADEFIKINELMFVLEGERKMFRRKG